MNDFDDLDDLFGQLRSDATEAELAGETSHVDAMARHHRRQKGPTMFTSRRARVATFIAAGVLGFGGIAAAGAADPFDLTAMDGTTTTTTTTSEVTTTTSEVTTTTSEAPTTTSEVTTTTSEVQQDPDAVITQSVIEELPPDEEPLVDDPETTFFDESTCRPGNHGKTVSAVAHGESPYEDVEQRDAARSSCGKDVEDDDEDELVKQDEVDDGDHDDIDDDDEKEERPEKSERPGKSESAGKQGKGPKKHSDD